MTIESEGTPRQLTRTIDGSLLLLFQEAANNALRHGEATRIVVTVSYGARRWTSASPTTARASTRAPSPGSRAGHFGIDGMKKRMHWLGGTLRLNRRPGGGMEIHAGFRGVPRARRAICRKLPPDRARGRAIGRRR